MVVAVCSMAATAWGADWNMPTPYADGTFHTKNIRQFADDVKTATNGELTITVHSAGSLFKHPEIKRAVQTRQAEIGEIFISLLSNEDPVFAVDSLPFLATSYEQAEKLWAASKPALEKRLEEDGLKLLFSVAWPPQGLYANKEIDDVADLKGVKFRSYNAISARLAELVGAVPTQVEVPEIPQAFATGFVEAMLTSPTTGVDSQAWDFVKYYYDVQAFVPKNMVIVNQRIFDRLDESTKQALLDASAKAEERGWQISKEETERNVAILKERGMQVIAPSPTLVQQLGEIGQTMTEEWLAGAGPEGQAIIDRYRQP
jgi:TRAP-type C4-dicarboxylate transport system substrate-binding protein